MDTDAVMVQPKLEPTGSPPPKKKKKYTPKPKKTPTEPKPKKVSAEAKPKRAPAKPKPKKTPVPVPPLEPMPKIVPAPTAPVAAEPKPTPEPKPKTDNPNPETKSKKSKGRNGNIYIGVFNRIEWMKLQEEFGFTNVNNFGTFVLETMKRVHGDVQFWCNVAIASGVYPDLNHYEWKNGFPHAINKEGSVFIPDTAQIPEDRRLQLGEMANAMWEERVESLQHIGNGTAESTEMCMRLRYVGEGMEIGDFTDGREDLAALENYYEEAEPEAGVFSDDNQEEIVCVPDVVQVSEDRVELGSEEVNSMWEGREVPFPEEGFQLGETTGGAEMFMGFGYNVGEGMEIDHGGFLQGEAREELAALENDYAEVGVDPVTDYQGEQFCAQPF